MPPSSLSTELQQSREESSRWQREAEVEAGERRRLAAELQQRHRELAELREAARDREERLGAVQVGMRLIIPPRPMGQNQQNGGFCPKMVCKERSWRCFGGLFTRFQGVLPDFSPIIILGPPDYWGFTP